MSDLKQVLQLLMRDGYVKAEGASKMVFTDKFYLEIQGKVPVESKASHETTMAIVRQEAHVFPIAKIEEQMSLIKKMTAQDWELMFAKFIKEAEVPRLLEGRRGETYYANKYSADGLKVFRKALESGVIYEVLVKSTMLYYKSSVKFKKAVGNYFHQGDWKTDYEAMMESIQKGELFDHVKQETQSHGNPGFTIG